MIVGPASSRPRTLAGSGAPDRPAPSKKIADCVSVAPRPPYSGGQWTAAQPSWASSHWKSRRQGVVRVLVCLGLGGGRGRMIGQPGAKLVAEGQLGLAEGQIHLHSFSGSCSLRGETFNGMMSQIVRHRDAERGAVLAAGGTTVRPSR